jgi:hypothetical protein
MAKSGQTSSRIATKASQSLSSGSSSPTQKSLAGSVLAQSGNGKQTSSAVATTAAKSLTDGRTNSTTRTLAGSALTQKP